MADEDEDRRTWPITVALLTFALAVIFGVFELRLRYGNADAMDGYALLGEHMLVVDRLHGGGESSPPGGTRLVLLDPATGRVAKRTRISEGLSFVAALDGVVWMHAYRGTFEAYDATTLERRSSEAELLGRVPALRALVDVEEAGCFDAALGAWRFTDGSGRYMAFGFRDQSISPLSSASCPPRKSVETKSGKLTNGKVVALRNVPNGKRDALFVGDHAAATPVGSLSFLEAHLLARGGSDEAPLLTTNDDDVFVVRRTGTRSEDPSELVRVALSSGEETWSARIDDGRARVEQVDVASGRLFVRSGSRLTVIDVDSGAVRWRRGD